LWEEWAASLHLTFPRLVRRLVTRHLTHLLCTTIGSVENRSRQGTAFMNSQAASAFPRSEFLGAVFTLCRTLSGSLWPAMAAHAAFNVTLPGRRYPQVRPLSRELPLPRCNFSPEKESKRFPLIQLDFHRNICQLTIDIENCEGA
jgi:hypothetical protein